MLFADGYNLKKRRFFQNLYYINIFGMIGTILNFAVFASLIYCISYVGMHHLTRQAGYAIYRTWRRFDIWRPGRYCCTRPACAVSIP